MIQELVSASAAATAVAQLNSADPGQQNLRCPRCDSTNTKFCYYNNYNLTQPRHFCKTCRRYWTKGGALRNVPIGGGCRKNKISTPPPKSSSAYAKLRTSLSSLSSEFGKQSFHSEPTYDHTAPWPSPPLPQNSHILAFLRASQNPNNPNPNNPNPNPNPNGPHFSMPHSPSLWRTNQQPPSGFGEPQQNSGIQQLLERIKSSRGGGGLYYGNPQPVSNPNCDGLSILESVPASGGGGFNYLNSPFSWSDVVTPSASAYP